VAIIFWLKDESLESSDNLPDPDILAAEIVEDLRAALEQFEAIQADLAVGPAPLPLSN
jgi:type I restriction enzyme M protein